jgi:sugar transferase (PEP-CTERM/EpsH1 system associated)
MPPPAAARPALPPLVVHVVYRFDTGGLENGVVNLVNHLPRDAFRHAIVALTEVAPAFASRIERADVEFVSLHKPPGQGVKLYPRLAALFRQLQPAIVHTRNLAALECQVPAWWAGVPARVHGEHGRDVEDLDGTSRKHQWMRRLYRPFVQRYVALSADLERYLVERVGVPPRHIAQIYNGVDTARFCPAPSAPHPGGPLPNGAQLIDGCPFDPARHFIVGTVGRMQTVKNQTLLVEAFIAALAQAPALRERLRLVLCGEGPLREAARQRLQAAGVLDLAWLPGERRDVPAVMRGLHAFVLPSLAEGVSNTILEAMASGLPVVATAVGGNVELVQDGVTGRLVSGGDVAAMAQALVELAADPVQAQRLGARGLASARERFSLQAMTQAYAALYQGLIAPRG